VRVTRLLFKLSVCFRPLDHFELNSVLANRVPQQARWACLLCPSHGCEGARLSAFTWKGRSIGRTNFSCIRFANFSILGTFLLQADWTLFGGKDLVQTRLTATWSTVRVTPSQVLSRCASHHPFAVHSVYEGTVLVRIGSVRTLCGI
jgi:hypothetical protein